MLLMLGLGYADIWDMYLYTVQQLPHNADHSDTIIRVTTLLSFFFPKAQEIHIIREICTVNTNNQMTPVNIY